MPAVSVGPAEPGRAAPLRRRAAGLALPGVLVVMGLTGCLLRPASVDTTPPPREGPTETRLWLSAASVPPAPVEIVVVPMEEQEGEFSAGVVAGVERWDGDSWVPHRELTMCQDHWHCTAGLQPVGSITGSVDLEVNAGAVQRFTTAGLEVGWYRVAQGGAHGTFRVDAAAAAPAPLWPVDEPAISVSPAVVPVAATAVVLSPLVPPGEDGSLSAESVRLATDDLSATVVVERWDGDRWTPAAEVVGEVRDPVDVYAGMRVELPELAHGEYRVVRSGADGVHTGRFWVDGDLPPAPDRGAAPCVDVEVCGLNEWLDVLVRRAGWTGLGGGHDYRSGSEVVDLGDGRTAMLRVVPDDPLLRDVTVDRTTPVGLVTVEHGTSGAGTPRSEFTCGAFRFAVAGDDPATVAEVAQTLALGIDQCFADGVELWSVLGDSARDQRP